MNKFELYDTEKHSADFTVENYVQLLRLAKNNYRFIDYRSLDSLAGCVLWRHDIDLSLNRACRLAQIECDEGVKATYFLNPHSEFYNLFEKQQSQLIQQILSCGHDIALHLDALYFSLNSEDQLEELVEREAMLLQDYFGAEIHAFSFHNPDDFTLTCEQDSYGGLINCYSKYFKSDVPYCSDSNGYWRHRRLYDVLEDATDPCLQVLTHPGLWQETRMAPRERVFRCIYDRAKSNCDAYDQVLQVHGRENIAGPPGHLCFLKEFDRHKYYFYDYLWNQGYLEPLLIELYRLSEIQILRICSIAIERAYGIAPSELDRYLSPRAFVSVGVELFELLFNESWAAASGSPAKIHFDWINVCKVVFVEGATNKFDQTEACCIHFCEVIESLARWAVLAKEVGVDGISNIESQANRESRDSSALAFKHWEDLQLQLEILSKA